MIITLKKNTPQPEIDRLIQNFEKQGRSGQHDLRCELQCFRIGR